MRPDHIYVGIKAHVLALDRSSGVIVWQAELPGFTFVNLADDGERVFALSAGELFCLDARDGRQLWHNKLKGFGTGFGALLVPGGNNTNLTAAMVAKIVADEEAAASQSHTSSAPPTMT